MKFSALTRRSLLKIGSVSLFGLSLPRLLQLEAAARAAGSPRKVKSCIFLYLYGGPSQIDIWDMKPAAPLEYRGEFQPIQTTVPGYVVCEHLPRMARLAHRYSVIRTLHHKNVNHQPAGSYLLTGVDPGTDNAGQLKPRADDPPALGALASRLAPPRASSVPPFVMMPARLHDQGSAFRGQTGGWLGSASDPFLMEADLANPRFKLDSFEVQQEVSAERLGQRRSLLSTLDQGALKNEVEPQTMTQFQERAFDLIARNKGESPFDLSREPASLRDRYGRNRFGQGCLLARRLIEAGARMVTVSDCTLSGGHEWDTHNDNFNRLKKSLLPRLDQAYSTLLEDLLDRGLLEETVVYVGGEFGRTPKVGQRFGTFVGKDGRDHYPNCFCGLFAGGYIQPGQVWGTSDSKAAFPVKDPVSMEDLAATLFAAMGLDPHGVVRTRDDRPVPVMHGHPVTELLR